MLTITRSFLVVFLFYSTSAHETRCFPLIEGGSLCYTQPVPPQTLTWANALQWCKNIGATLPIADNKYHNTIYGNAIEFFGLDTQIVWMGANSTYNLNEWYWAGGEPFTGTIEQRNVAGRSHAYIRRDGTNFRFVAEIPWEFINVLCQTPHSEVMCANNPNSYWTGGKCYRKQLASASWNDAWYSCGLDGGGLAVIDHVNDFSRWLDNQELFWIGLRSTWWTWQDVVTGNSFEVTTNLFNYRYPDGNSAECLASFKDWNSIYGYHEWMNQNCANNLQFVCQQYVSSTTINPTTDTTSHTSPPTTILDTTITTIPDTSVATTPETTVTTADDTSIITEIITSTSEITTNAPTTKATNQPTTSSEGKTATASSRDAGTSTFGYSNSESSSVNYALPFGLAVGIGGGMLMGVIVWVSILTVHAHKNFGLSRVIKVFPQ